MQRPGHSWSRPFSLMASASLSRVMGLLRCRVCEHAGVSCHVGTNRCMWVSIDSCGCLSPESHPQNRRSLETRPGERHPHAANGTHTRRIAPTRIDRDPHGATGELLSPQDANVASTRCAAPSSLGPAPPHDPSCPWSRSPTANPALVEYCPKAPTLLRDCVWACTTCASHLVGQ